MGPLKIGVVIRRLALLAQSKKVNWSACTNLHESVNLADNA